MRILLLGIFTCSALFLQAQLNVELLSNVTYESAGSDIWGYVAPDGSEYAIFGTFNGVSVVNVTDPRNPEEVNFIEQQGSMWRDIKTWGEFAYVTSDQGGTTDGLLVIDMRTLPDSISYVNINPDIQGAGVINTCHNIYIDEFGFAYLAGCNINGGGLVIFDVDTTPGEPIFTALGPNQYSHDVYVRDNIAYSAEINIGVFAVYDVSDKSQISLLAQQATPFNFTHNLWLSDDGNTIFTTDELANAPVAAYDISDLSNIELLDEYRPSVTLNTGVIPHNVHVWNDWLIISYYTDGCIIVDASRPDNLVEVGNFDTFFPDAQGFNGAWGAYPFLPSGNILIGDVNEGLFVLGPTYVRAAHLEGFVRDQSSGIGINGATIESTELGMVETSKATGEYKTGSAFSGDYEVTASAFGYKSQTKTITFENGEVAMADFELEALPRVNVTGTVVEADSGLPVPESKIKLSISGQVEELETGIDGTFSLSSILAGQYDIVAGLWGYKYTILEDYTVDGGNSGTTELIIELEKGYEDIFSLDLGWTSEFAGAQGAWERGDPIGQSPAPGVLIAPEDDSDDFGAEAYVTGNATDFFNSLLFGNATLISPGFDCTEMNVPTISYQSWIWASDFNGDLSGEEMFVMISNGIDTVTVDTVSVDLNNPFMWIQSEEIKIADYIEVTSEMKLMINLREQGFSSAVEGGFDDVKIYDSETVSITDIHEIISLNAFPNPSADYFSVNLPKSFQSRSNVKIFSTNGQLVESHAISNESNFKFGSRLLRGMYFVQIIGEDNTKAIFVIRKI